MDTEKKRKEIIDKMVDAFRDKKAEAAFGIVELDVLMGAVLDVVIGVAQEELRKEMNELVRRIVESGH